MASVLPMLPTPPAEYTGTVRYPLNDLLILARSIFKSLEKLLHETADKEGDERVEKERTKSRLSDLLQCISAVDSSRLKDRIGENDIGTEWSTSTLRHSAEEALFRLNGEVGWVVEAAITYRRVTREDPPTDDQNWRREDALLDLLQFITKKEHSGIFKPTDHIPVKKCCTDTNSQSKPSPFLFTGSLLYPFEALIALARFIIKDLESDKIVAYDALEAKEGEEEGDLSSFLLTIAYCRMTIDGAQWKVETLEQLPTKDWNDTIEQFLNDPRGSEKELFKLRWQSIYIIQEAIKYRKEKRGDAISSDPDWRNEDALLDLLLFVANEKHGGIFELDDSSAPNRIEQGRAPGEANNGAIQDAEDRVDSVDSKLPASPYDANGGVAGRRLHATSNKDADVSFPLKTHA